MSLFRGHTYRNIDPKGRVVVPADFREVLLQRSPTGRVVLTIYDHCVVGYPEPDWLVFEEQFSTINAASLKVRQFRRMVIGGAEVLQLDTQGRVKLSRAHMEYANLKHEAVFVGQGNKFEIWTADAYRQLLEENFDDVAEELASDGLGFML